MKKWLCYLLLSIATLGFAKGATFLRDYSTNDVLITAGFIPDSSRIVVGEPLFLTFVVSNRAEMPFQFCRIGTEIFSFAATNESGVSARNPFLHMMDGNGIVSSVKVDSGKSFICRLFLNGWCEFDKPGDYTVTCHCKFGRCFRHPYNMRLMDAIEFSPNEPKYSYKWTCDQNRDGTEAELAENRQILSELKAWLEKHKQNSE